METAREFEVFIARGNLVVKACSRTRVKEEEEAPAEPLEDTLLLWEISDSFAGWESAQERSGGGCSA